MLSLNRSPDPLNGTNRYAVPSLYDRSTLVIVLMGPGGSLGPARTSTRSSTSPFHTSFTSTIAQRFSFSESTTVPTKTAGASSISRGNRRGATQDAQAGATELPSSTSDRPMTATARRNGPPCRGLLLRRSRGAEGSRGELRLDQSLDSGRSFGHHVLAVFR